MIMCPQDRTTDALERELILQKITREMKTYSDAGLNALKVHGNVLLIEAIRIERLRRKAFGLGE